VASQQSDVSLVDRSIDYWFQLLALFPQREPLVQRCGLIAGPRAATQLAA